MIVGDLVSGVRPGELLTYPGEVIDDRAQLERSAARLLDYEFDALLLCDGERSPPAGRGSRGSRGALGALKPPLRRVMRVAVRRPARKSFAARLCYDAG
ncbi:MAG: hypothetical protein ICV69_09030 [Thermoleophilaceae bacterium]|nr:hypothetical protein [Thermoleophilaceae bacterium]